MEFKEATDPLTSGISLADLATEMGVSLNSVLRARMTGPNSRKPPEGWEKAVAKLAREHGHQLLRLANRLDAGLSYYESHELDHMMREVSSVIRDREWHSRTALAEHLLNSGVLRPRIASNLFFLKSTPAQRRARENQDENRKVALGAEFWVEKIVRPYGERIESVEDLNGTVRYRLTR